MVRKKIYLIALLCLFTIVIQAQEPKQETLSFDGVTKIESRLNGEQRDLYISHIINGSWSAPTLLPPSINTADDESWPSLSSDEQELYFVRKISDPKDKKNVRTFIMRSRKRNGEWTQAEAIVISDGNELSPFIMPDNQTLFFASKHTTDKKKAVPYSIYFTRKVDRENWYTPRPIITPTEKNVDYFGLHPSNRVGGLPFEFIEARKDGKNYLYTTRQTDVPADCQPLPVMTVTGAVTDVLSGRRMEAKVFLLDEMTQHVIAELQTYQANYKVALPAGRRYILDITQNDYSHHYRHYDLRNLKADTIVTTPVRLARKLTIHLYTFDATLETPIQADQVQLHEPQAEANIHGDIVNLKLPIGEEYHVTLLKRGYAPYQTTFDTRKGVLITEAELDALMQPGIAPINLRVLDAANDSLLTHSIIIARQGEDFPLHVEHEGFFYFDTLLTIPFRPDTIPVVARLQSLRQNAVMRLKNIQFEFNSADLLESSYEELDRLANLMLSNPNMIIELSAHTDDRGSDAFNMRLSQRRGERAKNYLIGKGIAPNRLQAVGYGKRKPIVPNDTEANRFINRRVEFKIIEL